MDGLSQGSKWPLIGRDAELELLRGLLRSEEGAVLAGEAGTGKTRLAREIVRSAEGFEVQSIVATPGASGITLAPFSHLLPADFRGDAAEAFRLLHATLATGDGRPPLLFVDDAHLLDDASAAFVHQVAARGTSVIATVRSGQDVPASIVALWKDGFVERIEVLPLSRVETDALVRAALDGHVEGSTLQRLWDATSGNVLFVHELVTEGLAAGSLLAIDGVWMWDGPLVGPRLADLVRNRLRSGRAGAASP